MGKLRPSEGKATRDGRFRIWTNPSWSPRHIPVFWHLQDEQGLVGVRGPEAKASGNTGRYLNRISLDETLTGMALSRPEGNEVENGKRKGCFSCSVRAGFLIFIHIYCLSPSLYLPLPLKSFIFLFLFCSLCIFFRYIPCVDYRGKLKQVRNCEKDEFAWE